MLLIYKNYIKVIKSYNITKKKILLLYYIKNIKTEKQLLILRKLKLKN